MTHKLTVAALVLALQLLSGCSDISELSNVEQNDSTVITAYPDAVAQGASLLSAFYGLDDAIPFFASFRICGSFGHQDGMPVIFSRELDVATVQAGDFLVTLADGDQITPACVTPAPAADVGELRTMLLIGDFGSKDNQPVSVEITGDVISLDHQTSFQGASVGVTPLEQGPSLVLAEIVDEGQWELGKQATALPFGGGDGCPASTRQVVRVVWSGGVTKPGGDEVDDLERSAYRVLLAGEAGELITAVPFALGDLGDGDNNHELCLDTDTHVVRVEFPENLLTDPREDLNPATGVSISY